MNDINQNIELFFIDLDGTALDIKNNGQRDISKSNIKQIKETMKTKKVVISTGKMWKSTIFFIKKVGVDYAVLGNGSQVVDKTGKILFEKKLSKNQVWDLVKIAKKHKLALKVDDYIEMYGASNKGLAFIAKAFKHIPINSYELKIQKYYKMIFWGKFKSQIHKILNEIQNTIDNVSAVTSANGWIIEVTNINATKGKGNEFIAKNVYNIFDKNKSAHIGDSMNDSTVIGHVGRLIVMKNSNKKLKQLSKYLGPSYKKAGLAKILQGNYKRRD